MKTPKHFLLTAALIFQSAFAGATTLVSSLRSSEGISSRLCATCARVQTKAVEFGNGNTDVQVLTSVAGQSVSIVIKDQLSADDFMELLIQVRALRSMGAREVVVEVANAAEAVRVLDHAGQLISLDTESLLSTAGADQLVTNAGVTDLHDLALEQQLARNRRARSQGALSIDRYVVDSVGHDGLATDLAKNLGLSEIAQHKTLTLQGRGVLLVASQMTPVNETYLKTLSRIEALDHRGAQVHAVMGYLPYARSDKSDRPGVTTTAALAADLLKTAGIRGISYVRAHAPQSSGFYAGMPQSETMSFESVKQALKNEKIDLVVSPDAGAQKEATKFADHLEPSADGKKMGQTMGVPVAVINKQRDGNKTVIRGISLPSNLASLNGLRVLIVDDETASGGTLRDAAEYLKSLGAEAVFASVTHLAGQPKAALESDAIDQLIVTDSIPLQVKSPKVKIVSIAGELARDVRAVLWGHVRCEGAFQ